MAETVRPGEDIDVPALSEWLETRFPPLGGPVRVEQFPAGHSNLTYLIHLGDRRMVLRRPPHGARIGHDMAREFRVLTGLFPVWPYVPEPLAFCDDPSVLGAPFYLMTEVEGVVLRGAAPPAGVDLGPATMEALSERFVATLAGIHAVDVEAAGLADLDRGAGYVERQVRGWADRYGRSRTDDVPSIERAFAWLDEHRPPDSGTALVHNDFKYDNLVLDPVDVTIVKAVLDWEMATVGDPLMDLGSSLAYWVDPSDPLPLQATAFGPTAREGSPDRAQLVAAYARATGRDVGDPVFYYVYGLLKLAVIVQQIYYRYHHGYTSDPRFAELNEMVGLLGTVAGRAIASGRLEGPGA